MLLYLSFDDFLLEGSVLADVTYPRPSKYTSAEIPDFFNASISCTVIGCIWASLISSFVASVSSVTIVSRVRQLRDIFIPTS